MTRSERWGRLNHPSIQPRGIRSREQAGQVLVCRPGIHTVQCRPLAKLLCREKHISRIRAGLVVMARAQWPEADLEDASEELMPVELCSPDVGTTRSYEMSTW